MRRKFETRGPATFEGLCAAVGQRVGQRRRYRRVSVAELAGLLQVEPEMIESIEAGRADLRLSELWKLAEALDVTPGTLLIAPGPLMPKYPEPKDMEAVMERVRVFVSERRQYDRRFGKRQFAERMRAAGLPRALAGNKLWNAAFENAVCTTDELSLIWEAMDRVDECVETPF